MKIIKGRLESAKKAVIYGPEGIGKSTFAAQFPDPIFIDTEGSTKDMDVARFEKASSWTMLSDQVQYVLKNPDMCRTLVIDTIDWAEQMCVADVCARSGKKGIEDFGYGNGYVYAKEEFGRFLNLLEEVVEKGIHVVLTAHAQIRKFEQPDEMGAYDRWELKLGKKTSSQTSPLVKEWADMVLFVNYKTMVTNVDGQGAQKGRNKVQGGKRVMYTSHHPCWDAKNRYSLPEEMDFSYSGIAFIFEQGQNSHIVQPEAAPGQQAAVKEVPKQEISQTVKNEATEISMEVKHEQLSIEKEIQGSSIPKPLLDLMKEYNVDEWDIQGVVAERGYYTSDTPIENYDLDFVNGVLIGAWEQVYAMIKEMKENTEIPFD